MASPRMTQAAADRPLSERPLDDALAGCLCDLRRELREPPELVLRGELLRVPGAGRGRAERDGVALWLD
jgi:hypothetical protein